MAKITPKIPDIIKITYFWPLLEEWRFKEPFAKDESTTGDLIAAGSNPSIISWFWFSVDDWGWWLRDDNLRLGFRVNCKAKKREQ